MAAVVRLSAQPSRVFDERFRRSRERSPSTALTRGPLPRFAGEDERSYFTSGFRIASRSAVDNSPS
jgi:hypothetical protein